MAIHALAKKGTAKKTSTEPTKGKSHWKLTFDSNLETDGTDTNADMHSLTSSNQYSYEEVDCLENKLRLILYEIEATPEEDNFVLMKFENSTQGASSSKATAPIY